jgi:hypothetical protein
MQLTKGLDRISDSAWAERARDEPEVVQVQTRKRDGLHHDAGDVRADAVMGLSWNSMTSATSAPAMTSAVVLWKWPYPGELTPPSIPAAHDGSRND